MHGAVIDEREPPELLRLTPPPLAHHRNGGGLQRAAVVAFEALLQRLGAVGDGVVLSISQARTARPLVGGLGVVVSFVRPLEHGHDAREERIAPEVAGRAEELGIEVGYA